jgi:hypothetical protein
VRYVEEFVDVVDGGGGDVVVIFKNSIIYFFEKDVIFVGVPMLGGVSVLAVLLFDVLEEMAEQLIALLH